jgi:hypothetical protein
MDTPEEGSDEWLWFKPEADQEATSWRWQEGTDTEFYKSFRHDACGVGFVAMVTPTNRIQCWACGKFLRKPKYR